MKQLPLINFDFLITLLLRAISLKRNMIIIFYILLNDLFIWEKHRQFTDIVYMFGICYNGIYDQRVTDLNTIRIERVT